ncbi:TPA: ead/Ea22-like family protein [Enterobacter roggenkampii]
MSNIDKRALREAAEKALSAKARLALMESVFDDDGEDVKPEAQEDIRICVSFNDLTNPATVLALLDELEASENLAKQQGNIAVALFDEVTTLRRNADDKAPELRSQLEEAEKRIAELEARTLVPVEPTLDQLVAGKRRLTSTGRMSRLMSQRLAEVYRAMVNAAAAGKGEAS